MVHDGSFWAFRTALKKLIDMLRMCPAIWRGGGKPPYPCASLLRKDISAKEGQNIA